MNETPKPPPEARPSASVLLLRDAEPSLEVFMVQRHHQIDFATGAMVFPGGKVEPSDRDPRIRSRARHDGRLDDEAIAYLAAAVRETFEESGVLLAYERNSHEPVGAARIPDMASRYRRPLENGEVGLFYLLEAEDLELLCDHFVPFARWITPVFMPKRFETCFFVVEAPAHQAALHDGNESVDSVWLTVNDAVEQQRRGQRKIIFPTLAQLQKLGRSRTVAEALERSRSEPVVTVMPRLEKDSEGRSWLCLPDNAGYDPVRSALDNIA